MTAKVTMYRFKVSLVGERGQPISKLHRIIEVSGNAPFIALHEQIFEAFDRFDPHLFKFLLTRKELADIRDLYDWHEEVGFPESKGPFSDAIVHDATQFTIADAALQEKDIIHYWFDFGDDWMHRLRLEKIFQIADNEPQSEGWYCDTTKRVGKSPPQYDEDSLWNGNSQEAAFARISSILLALTDPQWQGKISWGGLQEDGVGDLLVEEGWIKPCTNPDDAAVLTEAGKAEAAALWQALTEKED
ncbi:MAG: hypothetical protein Q4G28_02745 [Neisseria sp.]|nr:hypothetical protein [Neisseria sp.]